MGKGLGRIPQAIEVDGSVYVLCMCVCVCLFLFTYGVSLRQRVGITMVRG